MIMQALPNLITTARLLLLLPLAMALYGQQYALTFFLVILAGVSDGLDGWIARRFDCTTRFGAIADPLADKLLMLVCFFSLYLLGHLPLWIAALVIGRDLVIVSGGLVYHFWIKRYQVHATRLSKWNTLFQILLILMILFQNAFGRLPVWSIQLMMGLMVITTLATLAQYVFVWARKALQNQLAKQA